MKGLGVWKVLRRSSIRIQTRNVSLFSAVLKSSELQTLETNISKS